MKRLLKKIVRSLNWLVIVAILLAYLAPFISPITFWPISFFGLAFKAILLCFVILIVVSLFLKTNMILKNAIVLVLGTPFLLRIYSVNTPAQAEDHVRVLSFNTYGLGVNKNINTSESIDEFLHSSSTDIALFQEWRYGNGFINKKRFPYQKRFSFHNSSRGGLFLVSNFKIVNSDILPFTGSSSSIGAFADLLINHDTVRLYCLHLETTRVKSADYHQLKKFELDSNSTVVAKNLAQRLKFSMQKRAQQVDDIKRHMKDCPYPTVIMGDLNDTPQSYAYQQLLEGKNDAFVEAGNGFEATYLKPFPFLRIDYILADKSMKCVKYGSSDDIYSDHKLIFADLQIK